MLCIAERRLHIGAKTVMTTKIETHPTEPQMPIADLRLKYRQVKKYVLKQIAECHLKPGDALPPERTLAKFLGLAVHTVRHGLDELTQEKVIQRVQGKGTFIRAKEPTHQKLKLNIYALIVPEVVGCLYPLLIKGFIGAAAELGHQVLVCNTRLDRNVQGDMILQLINKNIAGVVIVPTIDPMPVYQFNMLRSHGIPVVFCHRRPPGVTAPLITWPWKEVGRRAAEAIVKYGHRRVAFVGLRPDEVSSAYLEGLREILTQNGLDLPDHRVLFHSCEEDSHRVLVEMLEAPDWPTAVFCNDTEEAELLFVKVTQLGLQVPQDLSIIAFGCAWREGALSQRLTSVTIDEVDLGRQAALLIERIRAGQEPSDGEENILVPLSFSEGQSLDTAADKMTCPELPKIKAPDW